MNREMCRWIDILEEDCLGLTGLCVWIKIKLHQFLLLLNLLYSNVVILLLLKLPLSKIYFFYLKKTYMQLFKLKEMDITKMWKFISL